MVIVMKHNATAEEINRVVEHIRIPWLSRRISRRAKERTIIGVIGDERPVEPEHFELFAGRRAGDAHPASLQAGLARFSPRGFASSASTAYRVGGNQVIVMAGPCSVESREQIDGNGGSGQGGGRAHPARRRVQAAHLAVCVSGAGPAEGLELLREAREAYGLPIVTEVMSPQDVTLVAQYVDMLQIGARNMQNFALLHAVGRSSKAGAAQAWLDVHASKSC